MSIRRAQDERIEGTPDGFNAVTEIMDVPDAPSASAVNAPSGRAYNNGSATITVTAAATGGTPTSYAVTSSPGSYTATSSSPVTVTGLQSQTTYTFTAQGINTTGTSSASSASGSITASTVPQAPTIGTPTVTNATTVSVPFTAGATGGSAITSYTATSSPSIALTTTGTSTPLTVTGTFALDTSYTFTITATNANGTSSASSASSSVSPNVLITNYESIATITLSTTASDVTFSSIPGTYKHLQIRVMASAVSGNQDGLMQFNGDTGTNYSYHFLYGSGAGSGSASAAATQSYMLMSNNFYTTGTSLCGVAVIDILDYTNTNKYKTMRSLAGADLNGSGSINLCSGNWRNTAAITSIKLYPAGSTINTYSSYALYGVK